jgi:thioredoxin 1
MLRPSRWLTRDVSTVQITDDTFEKTVTENDIVFVDFWAAWCGPCRQFGPVYEKVSEANPDVTFAKMDTDANRVIPQMANITSIPTLMAFRENVLVYSQPGAIGQGSLEQLVSAVKALDMAAVHAEVASKGSGHEGHDHDGHSHDDEGAIA